MITGMLLRAAIPVAPCHVPLVLSISIEECVGTDAQLTLDELGFRTLASCLVAHSLADWRMLWNKSVAKLQVASTTHQGDTWDLGLRCRTWRKLFAGNVR